MVEKPNNTSNTSHNSSSALGNIKQIMEDLQNLTKAAQQGEDIEDRCFEICNQINKLISFAFSNSQEQEDSEQTVLTLISSAKALSSKPDNPALLQHFLNSRKSVANTIRAILLRFGKQMPTAEKQMPTAEKAQETSASTSNQIIDILKSKFKGFQQEWNRQPDSKTNGTLSTLSKLGVESEDAREQYAMKEIKRIAENDTKDWGNLSRQLRQLTRKLESIARKPKEGALNLEGEIKSLTSSLNEACSDVLHSLNELFGLILNSAGNENELRSDLDQNLDDLFLLIKEILNVCQIWISSGTQKNTSKNTISESSKEVEWLKKILQTIHEQIDTYDKQSSLNQGFIQAVSNSQAGALGNYVSVKLSVEEHLKIRLLRDSNGLGAIMANLQTSINSLAYETDRSSFSSIYQVATSAQYMLTKLSTILTSYETLSYLQNQSINSDTHKKFRQTFKLKGGDFIDSDIWSADPSLVQFDEKNTFMGGSVDSIIIKLTEEADSNFLNTFITTYQSFLSPWALLEKLKQRYQVPPSKNPKDAQVIRLRVCVVLQHWIKNQFDDFNENVIEGLESFIKGTIQKEGGGVMAGRLINELDKQKEEHQNKVTQIDCSDTFLRFRLPDSGSSPSSYIVRFTEPEISRQLSLIEYRIYQKIKSSELLNQAWNSQKLNYRSPNVLELINRSNQLSQWVASTIVYHQKPQDRAKIITKFISIIDVCNFSNLSLQSLQYHFHTFLTLSTVSVQVKQLQHIDGFNCWIKQ